MAEPLQPASAEELKAEQEIFGECWKMLKKYYKLDIMGNYKEWGEFMDEAREIARKAAGTPREELAERLTLATILHIEKAARYRKEHRS